MKRYTEHIINDARLMAEWNWEENKNRGLDPHKLTPGSGKKASWICSQKHIWDTAICHRTGRGTNCPYCGNKKAWSGYNDLLFLRPDLMKEWDFDTNSLDPSTVLVKSNKYANWICPKGHKYSMTIYHRTEGAGCNICSRALRTSFPEQCFFFYTQKIYPDAINSYKDIFENRMELDIYIPSIKTGIEYDGVFWHDDRSKAKERKKYQICKRNNIRLLRIKEGEFKGYDEVADRIWYIPSKCDDELLDYYITEYLKFLTMGGVKLPVVSIKNDKMDILEFKSLKLEDSLAYQYPEIAKEWHPTRNGKLTPDLFTPKSSEKVWWICLNCRNEWKTEISNRTSGHGCNKCAASKRNETKRKNILSKRQVLDNELCLLDWDYELNEHTPDYYTNGSGERVNWRCHICGYRWQGVICDRSRGYKNACPLCSGKVIVSGKNDLATVRPELMKEWDYEKNVDLDPTKLGVGDRHYAFWICQKCEYVWNAQIYNRANGKGCPCCANRVVVPGKNDLATTDPDLAAEWHPTKNTLKPTEVTRGQSKKIVWLCSKCENEWEDTLNHRSSGRGCKECKKKSKIYTNA